jgi:hypothetical protein
MTLRPRTLVIALAVALAVAGAAWAATPPPSYVGAPGSVTAERPTAAELDNVREQVLTWLERNGFEGYDVSRVLAFTNNDYIVVRDTRGTNAFELLASPGAGWLMLDPPSLAWNTRFGMPKSWQTNWSGTGEMASLMGGGRAKGEWNGWYATGKAKVGSAAEAVAVARRWLAKAHPGETVAGAVRAFPGYYTVGTSYRGQRAAMVSVHAATGAVWYQGWLGGYLAGKAY